MEQFSLDYLSNLVLPQPESHKGQNGKLLLIGGSKLFHAASLWALAIASRVVDMVFYSSVPENNLLVQQAKQEFRDGIIVPRNEIEMYASEADCILIGPGMMRTDTLTHYSETGNFLQKINSLSDEGEQAYYLTKYLLQKYPQKKWVIDAGALQMIELEWLQALHGRVVLTPHPVEFQRVFHLLASKDEVSRQAKKYNCIIVLKGKEDVVASPEKGIIIPGGNAGMTKGGTGDVLAGLTAALGCTNELFTAAIAASFFNKKAAEQLYNKVGIFYNASDLVAELPKVMQTSLQAYAA